MIKKLFTSILLLTTALVSWGQDSSPLSVDWNDATKTLTMTLDKTVEGSWSVNNLSYSNVENLVLSGDFENSDLNSNFWDTVKGWCKNGIDLNLSGCKNLYSKFIRATDLGGDSGLETESVITVFEYEYPNMTPNYYPAEYKDVYLYKGKIVNTSTTTILVDDHGHYYYNGWLIDGKDVPSATDYSNPMLNIWNEFVNNGYQSTGQNGSWSDDGTVYTFTANGSTHTIKKAQIFVEKRKEWIYQARDNSWNLVDFIAAESQVTKNSDTTGTVTIYSGGEVFMLGNIVPLIKSITFPDNDNFTYISNIFAGRTTLESVTLSNKVEAIGEGAFQGCADDNGSGLTTINFPSSLTQIGKDAFNGCKYLQSADLSGTKISVIRNHVFNDCWALSTIGFPSQYLTKILTQAYQRCKAIENVDLSDCHLLRIIGQKAFEQNENLLSVKVCSHPKVIKGSEGAGAFNNCKNIKTVEVVGCMDAPDLTRCICENRAFAPDITYVQTNVADVEKKGARLIFPQADFWNNQMKEAGNNKYNYADAFDYFVGNYKEGVALSKQSNILSYFDIAPTGAIGAAVEDVTGTVTDAYCASDKAMADDRGIGNGWHEFMNISEAIVIPPSESFLRTYSRTEGSGPIVLPFGITAYRAVDYISTPPEIVKDRYNGNLWFIGDPNDKDDVANPDLYVDELYLKQHPECTVTGKPQYKYATVGGTLYLRPLHPVKKSNGEVNDKLSYVPEETGVVLYSQSLGEKAAFLVFKEYIETADTAQYTLRKYPHTGSARETERGEGDEDVINMLQGSYGRDMGVGPVWPWQYADEATFSGGTYNPKNIQYREFGFSKSAGRWLRLQPGRMKYNRAFAKLWRDLFDNPNETTSQMPTFTLDDLDENDTPIGTGSSNTFFVFGSTFEDEVADGIKTITIPRTIENDAWYTLQGVKVAKPTKGVYIHNNKKVVIK